MKLSELQERTIDRLAKVARGEWHEEEYDVGSGHSHVSMLLPRRIEGCKTVMRLSPPTTGAWHKVLYQRLRDAGFPVPSVVFMDGTGNVVPGAPVLHVVPSTRLSLHDGNVLLRAINPDLVIIDDQRTFQGASARRLRIEDFFMERKPRVIQWNASARKDGR